MPDKIDTEVFNNMLQTAEPDKTIANLFKQESDTSTEGLHTALMAAGFTPGYGNVADAADALLYAAEGEFGEAVLSGASAIPIIGQFVAGKRALKAAKEAGEEMVTLYRGVDKWYPGSMVKDGKFIGKQYKLPKSKKIIGSGKRIYATPDKDYAGFFAKHRLSTHLENSKYINPKAVILEFEVPKSFMTKQGHTLQESREYLFEKGLPKEFLKKVHK